MTLEWAAGVFCALVGAMLLAMPHRFEILAFAALQPHLPWWGIAFLLSGGGLLTVAVLAPAGRLAVVAHLVAGGAVLLMARGYAASGMWMATTNYAVFGLGAMLAPALSRIPDRRRDSQDRDLLVLLLGLGAVLNGLIMLVLPRELGASMYDLTRLHLAQFGMAFLVSGIGLLALQAYSFPRLAARLAYMIPAGTFFAFLLVAALPSRDWTGVAYYGGFGTTLALLSWADPLLDRLRAASLRVRFVMALTGVMILAMIVPVAVVGDWAESAATAQVMETQQVLATGLARDVHDFVILHRNAVVTLAATPGLLQMTPGARRDLVRTFARNYPDATVFLLIDAAGHVLVRSDDRPAFAAAGVKVFQDARRTNGPSLVITVGPSFRRPVLQFGMAILGAHGEFAGLAGAAVEPNRIFSTLVRAGAWRAPEVYLVDDRGRVIAHRDPHLAASFTDLSGAPPVAALLADRGRSGAIKYTSQTGEQLAAYARVPDTGWGVVVERPVATALAVAHAGRELSFVLHISVMVMVALAGTLAAGALAKPLEALAREADKLGGGLVPGSLPRSRVPEIARLSTAFEEMHTRLAARTAERERAEEALTRHARELARSNAELEAFAYVASHDLQEPLRMVTSYLQLLEKRHKRTLERDAKQCIAYAVDGATRMQQLISDLLVYSRVGTKSVELAPTDCGVVLQDVLGDLKMAIGESGAVVTHDPLPTVMGDALQMRQVFQNLIANAIKFRNAAGPQIHVSAERNGDGWVFAVRDNGIGIAPEHAERIFEIFQRLHTRSEYPGTGIGLAICKKIVECHGGRIWVESLPGQGATFRFTIPDGVSGAHA